jgi:aryl-alcohol dehydrogenase-like predicted oxidoreductase
MKYRLLGNSGLRVSEAALGTMTFAEEWGWGAAKDEARKVYETYREAGGNFIDTANLYTNGSSERFERAVRASGSWESSSGTIGRALSSPPNTSTPCREPTRTLPAITARA